MTASKRPTRLMEPTPSMSWDTHMEESRRSKLLVALVAVLLLLSAAGGIFLGVATAEHWGQ